MFILYSGGDPDLCQNVMGSKFGQDPSTDFVHINTCILIYQPSCFCLTAVIVTVIIIIIIIIIFVVLACVIRRHMIKYIKLTGKFLKGFLYQGNHINF